MSSDYSILASILSIVALLTFFAMAWRLGNLSNYVYQLGNRIAHKPFHDAEVAALLGKDEEAIEKYIEALYLVTFTPKYTVAGKNKKASTALLEEEIQKLKGEIPAAIIEENPFLSK
jgi:hypothetical protein